MPRIAYIDRTFRADTMAVIGQADRIATEYRQRGFDLTLRQLYYQFVSLALIPNTEQSYKRLGSIVNDARLAGLIDWNHLEDRGRASHNTGWLGAEPPEQAELIRNAQYGYSLDLWEGQEYRVEVWVEKQALEQVAQRAAGRTRTGYFACKGYVSQSEMWRAGRRMRDYIRAGQQPIVLHLGDHDPSGIDMTRDIGERLSMFAEASIDVVRIALNMPQIDAYAPPPNPAKVTDSRFESYQAIYGHESWELDALRPEVLVDLIVNEVNRYLNRDQFSDQIDAERRGRSEIEEIADRWDEVRDYLGDDR